MNLTIFWQLVSFSNTKPSLMSLSQREHEVFILLGEGHTLIDISRKLFIKPKKLYQPIADVSLTS